jgi:pyruvate dehydrogenase E1 component beta subunit
MVGFSLEAGEILIKEHDIDVEVTNLRCLRPLDRECIIESVKKTNGIVNVEEWWPQKGVGAEIAALLMETDAFDYLDAPMEGAAGVDVPIPYSQSIERLAAPQVEDIAEAVLGACYRN